MRLQPLVVGVLAACASPNIAPPALAPGPHNVVLHGVRFFYSVGGTAADMPPVVFLHGGPGFSQRPFAHANAELERDFVVVHWDQRGTGRSYRPGV